jgi:hypothetical protein
MYKYINLLLEGSRWFDGNVLNTRIGPNPFQYLCVDDKDLSQRILQQAVTEDESRYRVQKRRVIFLGENDFGPGGVDGTQPQLPDLVIIGKPQRENPEVLTAIFCLQSLLITQLLLSHVHEKCNSTTLNG